MMLMENTLRVRRAEKRLTQWQTAQRLGVSQSRVYQIESGQVDPTEEERAALAKLFDVPESVIFPSSSEAVQR